MTQAISYFYEFYSQMISFVFEDMEIVTGVTFGWVMIVMIVLGILIKNVLAVPRSGRSVSFRKDKNDE